MKVIWLLILLLPFSSYADQLPKAYFDVVVALGRTEKNPITQQSKWITEASGFLYGYMVQNDPDPTKRKYYVCLVTNRHVLADHQQIEVRFNPEKSIGQVRSFVLSLKDEKGNALWFSHPDANVDISVFPINSDYLKQNGLQSAFIASDNNAANRSKIKSIGIGAGDGVYILGFPMGIAGEERNYIITRRGSIARISDFLEGVQPTYLIDALIYPGNSGGPVFSALDSTALEGTQAQTATYLIGVVRAYLPYDDVAVSQQTKQPRIVFEENSGLADVVPIDRVDETILSVLKEHPIQLSDKPKSP